MLTIADMIELTLLFVTLLPLALSWLRRRAAASHNDYWARILGAFERIANEIGETLLKLPPGADAAAVRQALIARAVKEAQTEFDTSVAKTGATADRLATTLDRIVSARLLPSLQVAAAVVPAPQPAAQPAA